MDGCLIILCLSTLIVNGLKIAVSDLFYDIKFLLVHTLCEWLFTYNVQYLCLATRPDVQKSWVSGCSSC